MSAFWTIHCDLPREGPGLPEDVRWAAELSGLARDAQICDVASGPGADVAAWLDVAPEGRVTAVEKHAPFVRRASAQFANDARVVVIEGDMAKLDGQFDMIWCAGAVYFLGIEVALELWRAHLRPGGSIAFSEPCYFTSQPPDGARAFWDGHPVVDASAIAAQIASAGFETVATRRISDAGWEAYYSPMGARIAALKKDADMAEAVAEHEAEIAGWRAHRAETGYLLSLVRPA